MVTHLSVFFSFSLTAGAFKIRTAFSFSFVFETLIDNKPSSNASYKETKF